MRARRWVAYHGLAINVAPDLAPFAAIVPCGIAGAAVTSVAAALGMRGGPGPDPDPEPTLGQPTLGQAPGAPAADRWNGAGAFQPSVPAGRTAVDVSDRAVAGSAAGQPAMEAGAAVACEERVFDPFAPEELPPIDLSQLRLQPGVELRPASSDAGGPGLGAEPAGSAGAPGAGASACESPAEDIGAAGRAGAVPGMHPGGVLGEAGARLVAEYAFALRAMFEDVFEVELVEARGGNMDLLGASRPRFTAEGEPSVGP